MTYFAAAPRLASPLMPERQPSIQMNAAVQKTESELQDLLDDISSVLSMRPSYHDAEELKMLQGSAICTLAVVDQKGERLGLSNRGKALRDGLDVLLNGDQASPEAQDLRSMVVANYGHGCTRLHNRIEDVEDRHAVRTPLLIVPHNQLLRRPLDLGTLIAHVEKEAAKPRVLKPMEPYRCPLGL